MLLGSIDCSGNKVRIRSGVEGCRGTYIGRLDGVPVPRNAKHSIAAGFRDERVRALLTRFDWDNVLDTSVATEASGNAYVHTVSVLR